MNKPNYRKEIINALIPFAGKDPSIHLLLGDMGFGAVDLFQKKFPDRIWNLGIMEQTLVGAAAGLAMSGLKPIVYTMVNFLAFRALEQVRIDVVKQNLSVKLIGTGANDYFRFLGYSHTCGMDDLAIMKTIGIEIFDPYAETETRSFSDLVSDWITSPRPSYIRV